MTQVLGRLKLDGRAKPVRPGGALHDVTPLQNLAKTLVFIRFYKGFMRGLEKMSNPAFRAQAAGSSPASQVPIPDSWSLRTSARQRKVVSRQPTIDRPTDRRPTADSS